VVLPHLFAVTKTPAATVIAVPPFLLLLAYLVTEAWRGGRGPLAALAAVLALSVLFPAVVKVPGYGYPPGRVFGGVMRQALWVLWHVAGALAVAAVLVSAAELARRLTPGAVALGRYVRVAALVFCLGVLGWLGFQTVQGAWKVTSTDSGDPSSVAVGRFAREHLPANAVLLCEEQYGEDPLAIMFYADRTCYSLRQGDADRMARQIVQAGGAPYIVSHRRLPLPRVSGSGEDGPSVYLWQP
jgi:hypothetical protein